MRDASRTGHPAGHDVAAHRAAWVEVDQVAMNMERAMILRLHTDISGQLAGAANERRSRPSMLTHPLLPLTALREVVRTCARHQPPW